MKKRVLTPAEKEQKRKQVKVTILDQQAYDENIRQYYGNKLREKFPYTDEYGRDLSFNSILTAKEWFEQEGEIA